MVFKCQEDSFLKEFTSKVVSCEKVEFKSTLNGKNDKIEGFEVILEDTIVFPEGGGQPSDHGYLNDQKVHLVSRKYDKVLHYVEKPFNVGDEITQKIDWNRRFDHMQQHSGQHLISAIIDRELKADTVSWYMGEDVSYIELNIPQISNENIQKIEDLCNESIREGRKVTVEIVGENTPEYELEEVRSTKGLPEDHKGDIRIINIDGIDRNMCCGTHVTNLSQLQVIKLLHCEKSKRKGQILLYFQVGNRVINRLAKTIEREQKLTSLLKTNPSQHPEFVEKLQQNVKVLNKNLQNVLKEIISFEVNKLKTSTNLKYFTYHRKEADADFMNSFIRELGRNDIFLFLSTGDEKGAGNILLFGDEKAVSELGNKICELLGGKGSGKGNRFQAKVTNMANRPKATKLIEEYFK